MERIGTALRGIYRDRLIGPDGQLKFDSGWRSNAIVNSCRALLTAFMKQDNVTGISFLQVGSGDPQWDSSGVPLVDPATTTMLEEPAAADVITALSIQPLDNGKIGLEIRAELGPDYPTNQSYPLREFGLFGKEGDTPRMINCVRHPVIHKAAADTLIRIIQLQF